MGLVGIWVINCGEYGRGLWAISGGRAPSRPMSELRLLTGAGERASRASIHYHVSKYSSNDIILIARLSMRPGDVLRDILLICSLCFA